MELCQFTDKIERITAPINSAWTGSLKAAMRQNCVWLPSLAFKMAVVTVAFAPPVFQVRLSGA